MRAHARAKVAVNPRFEHSSSVPAAHGQNCLIFGSESRRRSFAVVPEQPAYHFGARVRPQLAQDALGVAAGRVGRDKEPVRDLGVAPALHQEACDPALLLRKAAARGQRFVRERLRRGLLQRDEQRPAPGLNVRAAKSGQTPSARISLKA